MHPFSLQAPRTEAQAIAAACAGARYIAGGTNLIDLMREEVESPDQLLDINQLPLHDIRVEGDMLVLGALARMSDAAAHPETRQRQPMIAEALLEGASPQLRNVASIGGNLLQRVRCPYLRMLDAACNKRQPGAGCAALEGGTLTNQAILGTSEHCIAAHPSDLAVALVALDATLRLRGPDGPRSLPLKELYRLPGDTPDMEHNLQPGELILEVCIPWAPHCKSARYLKIRERASYEFAVVSVAAALSVEPVGQQGQITSVRLAAGGVGTRPWRLSHVESQLLGKAACRESFEQASAHAADGATLREGIAFKAPLLTRTVVRALELAMEAT